MDVHELAEARQLLYGQPLEAFVAERDALVKQVRAAGDRALANEIKALRKPSAIAAEVNQIVRADPGGVELILQAAALLRSAQEGALDGAIDPFALQRQYRAAIQALAQSAPSRRAEVRAALEAATIDEASNDALGAGCLVVVPVPVAAFGTATSTPAGQVDSPCAAPTDAMVVDELAERRAKRAAKQPHSDHAKQSVNEHTAKNARQRENEAKALAAEAKAARQKAAREKAEREKKRRRLKKALAAAAQAHRAAIDSEQAATTEAEHAERELAAAEAERASLEQALAAAVERQAQASATRVAAADASAKLHQRTAKAEAELDALATQLAALEP